MAFLIDLFRVDADFIRGVPDMQSLNVTDFTAEFGAVVSPSTSLFFSIYCPVPVGICV